MTSQVHFLGRPFLGKLVYDFRDPKAARRWVRSVGLSVTNAERKGEDYYFDSIQSALADVENPPVRATPKNPTGRTRKNRREYVSPYTRGLGTDITGLTYHVRYPRFIKVGDIVTLFDKKFRIESIERDVKHLSGKGPADRIRVANSPLTFLLFHEDWYGVYN